MEYPDISIGPDQWIKWVELDPTDQQVFYIDHLLEPAEPFWRALETDCVAACCGIGAFVLWPDDIAAAAAAIDRQKLVADLLGLKEAVIRSKAQTVGSSRLNNLFDRQVFLRLTDHILSCL